MEKRASHTDLTGALGGSSDTGESVNPKRSLCGVEARVTGDLAARPGPAAAAGDSGGSSTATQPLHLYCAGGACAPRQGKESSMGVEEAG